MVAEIELTLLSLLRNSATSQKSPVIRFSIVQIVRTKMVAEVVRRAGVKILKCFDRTLLCLIQVRMSSLSNFYLVKFNFSGWRSSMSTLSRSCWLLWSRGQDQVITFFNLVQFSGLINHPFSSGPLHESNVNIFLPENISEVNWNQSCSALLSVKSCGFVISD